MIFAETSWLSIEEIKKTISQESKDGGESSSAFWRSLTVKELLKKFKMFFVELGISCHVHVRNHMMVKVFKITLCESRRKKHWV